MRLVYPFLPFPLPSLFLSRPCKGNEWNGWRPPSARIDQWEEEKGERRALVKSPPHRVFPFSSSLLRRACVECGCFTRQIYIGNEMEKGENSRIEGKRNCSRGNIFDEFTEPNGLANYLREKWEEMKTHFLGGTRNRHNETYRAPSCPPSLRCVRKQEIFVSFGEFRFGEYHNWDRYTRISRDMFHFSE